MNDCYDMDSHLEAAYEDANGDPHGIGSPEWEEFEDDRDPSELDALNDEAWSDSEDDQES